MKNSGIGKLTSRTETNSKKGMALSTAICITAAMLILTAALVSLAVFNLNRTMDDLTLRKNDITVKSALTYAEAFYNNPDISIEGTLRNGVQYLVFDDGVSGDASVTQADPAGSGSPYVMAEYKPEAASLSLTAYSGSVHLTCIYTVGEQTSGRITNPVQLLKNPDIKVRVHVKPYSGTGSKPTIYTWYYYDNDYRTDYGKRSEVIELSGNFASKDDGSLISSPGSTAMLNTPSVIMEDEGNGWFVKEISIPRQLFEGTNNGKPNSKSFNAIVSKLGTSGRPDVTGTNNTNNQTYELYQIPIIPNGDVYFTLNQGGSYELYDRTSQSEMDAMEGNKPGGIVAQNKYTTVTANGKATVLHVKLAGDYKGEAITDVTLKNVKSGYGEDLYSYGGGVDNSKGTGVKFADNQKLVYEGYGWYRILIPGYTTQKASEKVDSISAATDYRPIAESYKAAITFKDKAGITHTYSDIIWNGNNDDNFVVIASKLNADNTVDYGTDGKTPPQVDARGLTSETVKGFSSEKQANDHLRSEMGDMDAANYTTVHVKAGAKAAGNKTFLSYYVSPDLVGKVDNKYGDDLVVPVSTSFVVRNKYTGDPVKGVNFKINFDKYTVAVVTSDEEGKVTFKAEWSGVYSYQMLSVPDGYYVNPNTFKIEINAKGAVLVNKSDTTPYVTPYSNVIIKNFDSDTDLPIVGVSFGIYDSSKSFLRSVTTNTNGEFSIPNVAIGKYFYKQNKTTAINGYVYVDEYVEVNVGIDATGNLIVTPENAKIYYNFKQYDFNVKIVDFSDKLISGTGTKANIEVTKPGAAKSTLVDSDDDGSINITIDKVGKYSVKLTSISSLYYLNGTTYEFTVGSDGKIAGFTTKAMKIQTLKKQSVSVGFYSKAAGAETALNGTQEAKVKDGTGAVLSTLTTLNATTNLTSTYVLHALDTDYIIYQTGALSKYYVNTKEFTVRLSSVDGKMYVDGAVVTPVSDAYTHKIFSAPFASVTIDVKGMNAAQSSLGIKHSDGTVYLSSSLVAQSTFLFSIEQLQEDSQDTMSLILFGTTKPRVVDTGAGAPEATGATKRIYFDNSWVNWPTLNLYQWATTATPYNNPMMLVPGTTNMYYVDIDDTIPEVIFNRVAGNWDQQTQTLTIPAGSNCFKITGGSGKNFTGTWSTYTPPVTEVTVTVNNGANGTCDKVGTNSGVSVSAPFVITAVPSFGYEVLSWTLAPGGTVASTGTNQLSYTYSANTTVTPVYTAVPVGAETAATLPVASPTLPAGYNGYTYLEVKSTVGTFGPSNLAKIYRWGGNPAVQENMAYVGTAAFASSYTLDSVAGGTYYLFRHAYVTKGTGMIYYNSTSTGTGSAKITGNITTLSNMTYPNFLNTLAATKGDITLGSGHQFVSLGKPGLTATPTPVNVGDSVLLTATKPTTGSFLDRPGLKYAFYVTSDGITKLIGGEGAATSYLWKPTASGTYSVVVVVKDCYGAETVLSDAKTVVVNDTVSNVEINQLSQVFNTNLLNVTLTPKGSKISGVQYSINGGDFISIPNTPATTIAICNNNMSHNQTKLLTVKYKDGTTDVVKYYIYSKSTTSGKGTGLYIDETDILLGDAVNVYAVDYNKSAVYTVKYTGPAADPSGTLAMVKEPADNNKGTYSFKPSAVGDYTVTATGQDGTTKSVVIHVSASTGRRSVYTFEAPKLGKFLVTFSDPNGNYQLSSGTDIQEFTIIDNFDGTTTVQPSDTITYNVYKSKAQPSGTSLETRIEQLIAADKAALETAAGEQPDENDQNNNNTGLTREFKAPAIEATGAGTTRIYFTPADKSDLNKGPVRLNVQGTGGYEVNMLRGENNSDYVFYDVDTSLLDHKIQFKWYGVYKQSQDLTIPANLRGVPAILVTAQNSPSGNNMDWVCGFSEYTGVPLNPAIITTEEYHLSGNIFGSGKDWTFIDQGRMTLGTDGKYTSATVTLSNGAYELKVFKNQDMNIWWGGTSAETTGGNGNYKFTLNVESEIRVTYDPNAAASGTNQSKGAITVSIVPVGNTSPKTTTVYFYNGSYSGSNSPFGAATSPTQGTPWSKVYVCYPGCDSPLGVEITNNKLSDGKTLYCEVPLDAEYIYFHNGTLTAGTTAANSYLKQVTVNIPLTDIVRTNKISLIYPTTKTNMTDGGYYFKWGTTRTDFQEGSGIWTDRVEMAYAGGDKFHYYNVFTTGLSSFGSNKDYRLGTSKLEEVYDWFVYKVPTDDVFYLKVEGIYGNDPANITPVFEGLDGSISKDIYITLNDDSNTSKEYKNLSIYTVNPDKTFVANETIVYLKNDAGWTQPYIYTWGIKGAGTADYPGAKMSYDKNEGLWYAKVSSKAPFIVFSDGSTKFPTIGANRTQILTLIGKANNTSENRVLYSNKNYGTVDPITGEASVTPSQIKTNNDGWTAHMTAFNSLYTTIQNAKASLASTTLITDYKIVTIANVSGIYQPLTTRYNYSLYKKWLAAYDYFNGLNKSNYVLDTTMQLYTYTGISADANYANYKKIADELKSYINTSKKLREAVLDARVYLPDVHSTDPTKGKYPQQALLDDSVSFTPATLRTLRAALSEADKVYTDREREEPYTISELNGIISRIRSAIAGLIPALDNQAIILVKDDVPWGKNSIYVCYMYKDDANVYSEQVKVDNGNGFYIHTLGMYKSGDNSPVERVWVSNSKNGHSPVGDYLVDWREEGGVSNTQITSGDVWVYFNQKNKWQQNSSGGDYQVINQYMVRGDNGEYATYKSMKKDSPLNLYFTNDTRVVYGDSSYIICAGLYKIPATEEFKDGVNLFSKAAKIFFTDPKNIGMGLTGQKYSHEAGWTSTSGVLKDNTSNQSGNLIDFLMGMQFNDPNNNGTYTGDAGDILVPNKPSNIQTVRVYFNGYDTRRTTWLKWTPKVRCYYNSTTYIDYQMSYAFDTDSGQNCLFYYDIPHKFTKNGTEYTVEYIDFFDSKSNPNHWNVTQAEQMTITKTVNWSEVKNRYNVETGQRPYFYINDGNATGTPRNIDWNSFTVKRIYFYDSITKFSDSGEVRLFFYNGSVSYCGVDGKGLVMKLLGLGVYYEEMPDWADNFYIRDAEKSKRTVASGNASGAPDNVSRDNTIFVADGTKDSYGYYKMKSRDYPTDTVASGSGGATNNPLSPAELKLAGLNNTIINPGMFKTNSTYEAKGINFRFVGNEKSYLDLSNTAITFKASDIKIACVTIHADATLGSSAQHFYIWGPNPSMANRIEFLTDIRVYGKRADGTDFDYTITRGVWLLEGGYENKIDLLDFMTPEENPSLVKIKSSKFYGGVYTQ